MKKQSFRKLSIIGLILMGASAVTAAFIPSKEQKEANTRSGGQLLPSTSGGGVDTCTDVGGVVECNITANSGTTTIPELNVTTITTLRNGVLTNTTNNTTLGVDPIE
ncbi:hypothetical protein [Chitinophaga sp. XS-30]|uniref:hypothetical protein n=1 Tax=Chitinophaga sp. XS-30 TaxID=2604421 RepID=UPI0011DCDBD9|nr:hypothetical protein [Chitinophaga sp. XS-30]QEH42205.1 hypothetical protein FW415_15515 [Chitinophaga sp. XS-30]